MLPGTLVCCDAVDVTTAFGGPTLFEDVPVDP